MNSFYSTISILIGVIISLEFKTIILPLSLIFSKTFDPSWNSAQKWQRPLQYHNWWLRCWLCGLGHWGDGCRTKDMHVQCWVQWSWLQIVNFPVSMAIKTIWGIELAQNKIFCLQKSLLFNKSLPLLQKKAMKAYGFASGETGETSMASNLLKIKVYFTSLNVETVTEEPTYQVQIFKTKI